MRRKLTIFVDMDGTIENLLDVWLRRLNDKCGSNVQPSDILTWELDPYFPLLTHKEIQDVVKKDFSIWKEVSPIKGAKEVLQKWVDDGHDVYIVTSSTYESLAPKMEDHLFVHFPFINWKNVVVTNNKQLLHGDVLIDDGVHNLIGGNYYKILYDSPYSRLIDVEAFGIHRAYNWDDVESLVNIVMN